MVDAARTAATGSPPSIAAARASLRRAYRSTGDAASFAWASSAAANARLPAGDGSARWAANTSPISRSAPAVAAASGTG